MDDIVDGSGFVGVEAGGCGGSGGASPKASPRPAASAAGSPSLECLRNTVRDHDQAEHTHIIGNRCRSWFCEHCAKVQGPRLRAQLIDQVETWSSPMMLTFTVDPQFFESPEHAFKWVTEKRGIALVMKRLAPFLIRPAWFLVIEWHKSGWPHWHLLCDAKSIPIEKAREAWAKFVPKHLRHLVNPNIRSLGIVRFSKPGGFQSAKHAALYVSKYLTKYPEDGFPTWVMEARYRIRRYSTSRGFWGTITHRSMVEPDDDAPTPVVRTHEERRKHCCESCSVYRVIEKTDEATGEVAKERKFRGRIACHGTLLAQLVKDAAGTFRDLPVFIRGCFIDWAGTWPGFCEFFKGQVESGVASQIASMRLSIDRI